MLTDGDVEPVLAKDLGNGASTFLTRRSMGQWLLQELEEEYHDTEVLQ